MSDGSLPAPKESFSGKMAVTIIVIAIAAITTAAVVTFSRQKHAFDYPTLCEGNLRAISRALFAYQEAHGTFPPHETTDAAGKPLLSWRVLLLPYLKEKDTDKLYKIFNLEEAWDSTNNKRLASGYMPFAYHCPSVDRAKWAFEHTHYLAVTGPGTLWADAKGTRVDPKDKRILLVEYVGADIPWSQPRDLKVDQLTGKTLLDAKLGSPHGTGPLVLYADGTVERWPDNTPMEKLLSGAATSAPNATP